MNKDRFSELHKSFDCFKLHRQPVVVVRRSRRPSQDLPDVPDPGVPVGGLQRDVVALGSSGVRA